MRIEDGSTAFEESIPPSQISPGAQVQAPGLAGFKCRFQSEQVVEKDLGQRTYCGRMDQVAH